MGTALTERQLKELQRLTRRLYLCFDSDAAGEEATLRGMELATSLGFDVRVVTLPKGQDPADAPAGFEARLGGAESYIVYRVRLELDRTPDRQEAFVRGARDPAAQRGLAGVAGRAAPAGGPAEPAEGDALGPDAEGRRADAHRGALAEAAREGRPARAERARRLRRASRRSSSCSPSSRPEHFDSELHRRFRAHLVDGGELESDLLALRAELDARGAREGLDERTGKELLLNLRERRLRRELAHAEFDQMKELQTQLARVKDAILELA